MIIYAVFIAIFVLNAASMHSDPVCEKPDVSHAPGCQE